MCKGRKLWFFLFSRLLVSVNAIILFCHPQPSYLSVYRFVVMCRMSFLHPLIVLLYTNVNIFLHLCVPQENKDIGWSVRAMPRSDEIIQSSFDILCGI